MSNRIEQLIKLNEERMKQQRLSRKKRPIPSSWKRNNAEERDEADWDLRFQEISLFVQQHKRLPQLNDGDAYEKQYATQLHYMLGRLRKNKLLEKQEEAIKKLLLPYKEVVTISRKESHLKQWIERLEAISLFIEQHDRLPKYRKLIGERNDSVFLSRQRGQLKSGKLPSEKIPILKAFYKKHQQYFTKQRE